MPPARAILRSLLALSPALAAIAVLNSRPVPKTLASPTEVASVVLSGREYKGLCSLDDHLLQRETAPGLPAGIDTLLIGSSRTMPVRGGCFPGSFYNSSVSLIRLPDIIALYELHRARGRVPRRLVLAAEPWTLDSQDQDFMWSRFAEETITGYLRLGMLPPHQAWGFALEQRIDPVLRLFSPQRFRAAVLRLMGSGPAGPAYTAECLRRPDGSSTLLVDRSPEEVERMAVRDVSSHYKDRYRNFDSFDAGLRAGFETFLRDVTAQGTEVSMILQPVHPVYYRKVAADPRGNKFAIAEDYFLGLVSRLPVKLIGRTFDPEKAGLSASDFTDGVHLRDEVLSRFIGCAEASGASRRR